MMNKFANLDCAKSQVVGRYLPFFKILKFKNEKRMWVKTPYTLPKVYSMNRPFYDYPSLIYGGPDTHER